MSQNNFNYLIRQIDLIWLKKHLLFFKIWITAFIIQQIVIATNYSSRRNYYLVKAVGEAGFFGIMEATLYLFEDGYLFTSYQQFLLNILWFPIIINLYCYYFNYNLFLVTVFFPINVWINEILNGYLLHVIYGYNPCWNYLGKSGALLNGTICISTVYLKRWLYLGLFVAIVNKLITIFYDP